MRNKLLTDLAFRFWMLLDCSILKCTENNKSKSLKSFSNLWYIVALFIVHLNLSLNKRTFSVQKKSSRPHVIFDTDVRVRCINTGVWGRGSPGRPHPGLKNFRSNSVFRATVSCSKILNNKIYFRTVKNSGQLCFSGQAQVAQNS